MKTHHHPIRTNTIVVAVVLVLAALSAAAAHASASTTNRTASPQSVQIIRVTARGFDWGDAGIGAAAGIGISMLAVGASLILTASRRNHQPRARLTAKEQP